MKATKMKDEIVPVVDETDKIIGYKKRSEIRKEDIFRISLLWIENPKGQVLIAKRSSSKSTNPGKWGSAVQGMVGKGETYAQTILRESVEEIGLRGIKPEEFRKDRIRADKNNFFCQFYTLKIDKDVDDFCFNDAEVAAVRWVDKNVLKDEMNANPERFNPAFPKVLEIFVK